MAPKVRGIAEPEPEPEELTAAEQSELTAAQRKEKMRELTIAYGTKGALNKVLFL